jgi:hypothetical protein
MRDATLSLAGYEWSVVLVEPHDMESVTALNICGYTVNQLQGKQPEVCSCVDYSRMAIALCGSLPQWRVEDALMHEMGHILSWAMGLPQSEATANYFVCIMRELGTKVPRDVVTRLFSHLRNVQSDEFATELRDLGEQDEGTN